MIRRQRVQLIFDQSYVVRTVNLITQKNCVKIRLLTYTHLIFFYFTFKLTISCVPNDVNECNNFLSKFFLLRLLVVFYLWLLFSFVDLNSSFFHSLVCLLSVIGLSIDTVAFTQRKYFVSINCPSLHQCIHICVLYNIDIIFFFVSSSVCWLRMYMCLVLSCCITHQIVYIFIILHLHLHLRIRYCMFIVIKSLE